MERAALLCAAAQAGPLLQNCPGDGQTAAPRPSGSLSPPSRRDGGIPGEERRRPLLEESPDTARSQTRQSRQTRGTGVRLGGGGAVKPNVTEAKTDTGGGGLVGASDAYQARKGTEKGEEDNET